MSVGAQRNTVSALVWLAVQDELYFLLAAQKVAFEFLRS
jgi:hypothetical protein